jgi:hypothetical protein
MLRDERNGQTCWASMTGNAPRSVQLRRAHQTWAQPALRKQVLSNQSDCMHRVKGFTGRRQRGACMQDAQRQIWSTTPIARQTRTQIYKHWLNTYHTAVLTTPHHRTGRSRMACGCGCAHPLQQGSAEAQETHVARAHAQPIACDCITARNAIP